MSSECVQRRLAAILATDVVGYSRMMQQDELGTLARLKALHADVIGARIAERDGRIVKLLGDGALVEFPSVVNAVACAVAIQQSVAERNAGLAESERILLRVGLDLGDVVVENDDVFGDGVNIAARLQVLADPGGICVSRSAFDQVRSKVDFAFEDLGEQALKNIEEPVRVYRVVSARANVVPARRARHAPASASVEFNIPARPSIAIPPFRSLGGEAANAHLADALRLGVQAALVHVSSVRLLNPSSVEAYRDKDVPAATVGKELNVRYILEGAVQTAGSRMRAILRLTDAKDDEVVWAERYDRVLDDIFALQDEIIREVVAALNVQLLPAEASRISLKWLSHPEAREYFYRGIEHVYKGTKDSTAVARRMFEALQRIEPDTGVAPNYIALTHWVDGLSGRIDSTERSFAQAASWAERSIQLRNNIGFGYIILGHLKLLEGKHEEALARGLEAESLRFNCPLTHGQLANILNYCGEVAAAVKSARHALNLTRAYPVWMINVLAAAYRDAGDLGQSIAAATEALRLDPQQTAARIILCTDYGLAGRRDEARNMAREVIATDPAFRLSSYARGQPYKDTAVLAGLIEILREAGLPN